jgi:hypothetical protein
MNVHPGKLQITVFAKLQYGKTGAPWSAASSSEQHEKSVRHASWTERNRFTACPSRAGFPAPPPVVLTLPSPHGNRPTGLTEDDFIGLA